MGNVALLKKIHMSIFLGANTHLGVKNHVR